MISSPPRVLFPFKQSNVSIDIIAFVTWASLSAKYGFMLSRLWVKCHFFSNTIALSKKGIWVMRISGVKLVSRNMGFVFFPKSRTLVLLCHQSKLKWHSPRWGACRTSVRGEEGVWLFALCLLQSREVQSCCQQEKLEKGDASQAWPNLDWSINPSTCSLQHGWRVHPSLFLPR